MFASFVSRIVRFSSRVAWIVAAIALVVGAWAGDYALTHFAMDTNSGNLVAPKAAWRKNEARYDAAFPQQNNLIVVVVDGATAERAEEAARSLTAALEADSTWFTAVRRPDDGPFFSHEGFLLLPFDEVKQTAQNLIEAQPFLGGLAADPSLRGVMNTLSTTLLGVENGQTNLSELDKPIAAFADTLNNALEAKPAFFGWSSLINGEQPDLARTRRFIEVTPKLDYLALMPGEKATHAIRAAVKKLNLSPQTGVRVRLTGPVPMADEEFATLAEHSGLLASLMAAAVLVMLWLAVRSARMILAILATLIIGLAITASIGLYTYGAFNVISVAFIELFVGLGVDFGIQFSVRYRSERYRFSDLHMALSHAGSGIGNGLTLAAMAAAAGFLSFLPTDYPGLAQLGLIAGAGMIVTYILSITALPAFLRLLKPRGETGDVGIQSLAPLDNYLSRHAKSVVQLATAVGLIGMFIVPNLQFDANPLDLRNRHSQSVATALDLMKNPETSPNTVNVLRPSRKEADDLAARLSKLPEVSQAVTIDSFVPERQDEKLATVRDASSLLDSIFNPLIAPPPPTDRDTISSLQSAAEALRRAAATAKNATSAQARRLAGIMDRVAQAKPEVRARASDAFIPGLKTMLGQLRAALHPKPISYESLPPDLVRDWVSESGLYRVQVFPSGKSDDNAAMNDFIDAVLEVAPDATGTPIIIEESGNTIVHAFIKAGLLSFVSIALILFVALRRVGDLLMALAPLVLAGILTMTSCVFFGIQLNLANIIALPLLFGVGVAFDIYFVMAWRNGQRHLLQSPLTRAVVLSAGTTAAAFGTLSISSHPGTASMGLLLLISLFWILVSMLLVLPALLTYALPREGLDVQPQADS